MVNNLEKEIQNKETEINQFEELKTEINQLKQNNKSLRDEVINLIIKNRQIPTQTIEEKTPTEEEIIEQKIKNIIKQMKGNFNK